MRWKDKGILHYTNISFVQWDLTNKEETSAVFAAIFWCTAGHDDSLILRQRRGHSAHSTTYS